jgi:hypothetical protein
MKYRFTVVWAHVLITIGLVVMFVALASGLPVVSFGQKGSAAVRRVDANIGEPRLSGR